MIKALLFIPFLIFTFSTDLFAEGGVAGADAGSGSGGGISISRDTKNELAKVYVPEETMALAILTLGFQTNNIEKMDVKDVRLRDVALLKKKIEEMQNAINQKLAEKRRGATEVKPVPSGGSHNDDQCVIEKGDQVKVCANGDEYILVKTGNGGHPVEQRLERNFGAIQEHLNRGGGRSGRGNIPDEERPVEPVSGGSSVDAD